MIKYVQGGSTYILSYRELRQKHIEICEMTDDEFIKSLPTAMHLACVICFLKEKPATEVLADNGIIHMLAHLMDNVDECVANVRLEFKNELQLAI